MDIFKKKPCLFILGSVIVAAVQAYYASKGDLENERRLDELEDRMALLEKKDSFSGNEAE